LHVLYALRIAVAREAFSDPFASWKVAAGCARDLLYGYMTQ
jgi:hypothetical protein